MGIDDKRFSMPGPEDFFDSQPEAPNAIKSSWSADTTAVERIKVEKKESRAVILCTAVVGIVIYMLGLSFNPLYNWLSEQASIFWTERTSFILGQISVTFLTVSVLSILSEHSKYVYWENEIEKKLISPVFSCYKSYTIYSFATILGSTISMLCGNAIAFALFFIVNVVVVFMLTINMIDIYYNTNRRKIQLQAEFEKLVKTNFDQQKLTLTLDRLFLATAQAYEGHSYDTVSDNLDFMLQYASYMNGSILQNIMRFADEIYSVKIGLVYVDFINTQNNDLSENSYMNYEKKRVIEWLFSEAFLNADVLNHAVRDTFLYNVDAEMLAYACMNCAACGYEMDMSRACERLIKYLEVLKKDEEFRAAWGQSGVGKLSRIQAELVRVQ